jgi:hypothetical protein
MSGFLRQAGLSQAELESLKYGPYLDALVQRLCPKMREWLMGKLGKKATCLVMDLYGLYGNAKRPLAEIAGDLGLTESHARALHGWALKRLRGDEEQAALKAMAVTVARDVLHHTSVGHG